ncbi:MAG: F0F1 ATP synthase subunit B [Candidatus Riflebacteria bacterium]
MKTKFRLFLLLLLLSMLAGAVFASGPAPAETAHAGQEAAHQPSLFEFSWAVLISQAINFLVLLFILNHFLFKPLGKILEERRESIGKIRINAEEEHRTALALKEVYEKHLANIEQEAYEIKQQAIHDANLQTAEIVLEAKLKAERIIEEGEMQLFNERQAAWMQLREEVVHLTLVAAERVVEQSLNDDIHRKLIKNTIERLETELPYHVSDD